MMPSGTPGMSDVSSVPNERTNGTGDDLDNEHSDDPAQMKQDQERLRLILKNVLIITSVVAVVLVAYRS